jgi:hypothetical protein
VIVIG